MALGKTMKGLDTMLTQKIVDTIKPTGARQMLHDRDGLYLRISPTGKKSWVCRQYIDKREHLTMLGAPPYMSLAEARFANYEHKRIGSPADRAVNFGTLCKRYIENHGADKSRSTHYQYETYFRLLAPLHGHPVRSLTRSVLASAVLTISETSTAGNAQRTARFASAVCDYAVDCGLLEHSPAQRLARILPSSAVQHLTAVTTEREAGAVFKALDHVNFYSPRYCLKLIALTAVRSIEARGAEWAEFDFESRLWTVPEWRTKKRRALLVPLSVQTVELLQRLRQFVSGRYVFPTIRKAQPITGLCLSNSLRRLQELPTPPPISTVHGFRSTASTLLHEAGFQHEVIESQLAHLYQSATASAYNRTQYLPQRREMLQWWADKCCSLGLSI